MRRTCSLSNGGTFTVDVDVPEDIVFTEFEILAEGLMAVARKVCPKIANMPEGARITVWLSKHDNKSVPGFNFFHLRVHGIQIESYTLFGMRKWYADCKDSYFKQMINKHGTPWPDEISEKIYLRSATGNYLYSHVFGVMREMLAVPFTLQDEKR